MDEFETVDSEDEATHVRLPVAVVKAALEVLGRRPFVEVSKVIPALTTQCVLLRQVAPGEPDND